MTKRSIDTQVSGILGIHQSQVALVTTTFLRLAGLRIARTGQLYLEGLGEFTRDDDQVRFRKGPALHRVLKENVIMSIEKYGVDEGQDDSGMEKAATNGCPKCGSTVEKHGTVLSCPKCGTEPFEKKSK